MRRAGWGGLSELLLAVELRLTRVRGAKRRGLVRRLFSCSLQRFGLVTERAYLGGAVRRLHWLKDKPKAGLKWAESLATINWRWGDLNIAMPKALAT